MGKVAVSFTVRDLAVIGFKKIWDGEQAQVVDRDFYNKNKLQNLLLIQSGYFKKLIAFIWGEIYLGKYRFPNNGEDSMRVIDAHQDIEDQKNRKYLSFYLFYCVRHSKFYVTYLEEDGTPVGCGDC